MTRTIAHRYAYTVLAAMVVMVAATACTSPKFEDLTTVERGDAGSAGTAEVRDPDSVTVLRNVDQFPNLNIVCYRGAALINRSSNYEDWQTLYVSAPNEFCHDTTDVEPPS